MHRHLPSLSFYHLSLFFFLSCFTVQNRVQTPMMSLPNFFVVLFITSLTPTLTLEIVTPLIAPISKDNSTLLFTLSVFLETPLRRSLLFLDLGSSFSWLLCPSNSSSSLPIPCNSSLCSSLHSAACSDHSCALFPENPLTRNAILDVAFTDSLALPSLHSLSHLSHFVFSCAIPSLLQSLPHSITGLAALSRSNFSLPAQISTALSSPRYFALCLPSSAAAYGVAFFASTGPYIFSSKIDLSKSLIYTPLVLNPVGDTVITYDARPSDEYFIQLSSILVNGKPIPVNGSMLRIDENGFGGCKISTAIPYTLMESSIYKAFTQQFLNESSAFNLTATSAVEPFGVCFPASDLTETRVGPAVPTVDLVMQSEDVFWRIFGSNSMVRISREGEDLWCLGFVDGGTHRRTPIVIGGHQLEDNLVQFDLQSNRLGFTSSVLLQGTTCANFNVTL